MVKTVLFAFARMKEDRIGYEEAVLQVLSE